MTVIMAAVVARSIAADPTHGVATAFTVVMLAGIFQIVLGSLKLGRYITMMPYSVTSGFMSGIGVLLILTQLAPLLGQQQPSGGAFGTILALPRLIEERNTADLTLALIALVVLFAVPKRWQRYLPPPLVALVVGSAAAWTLLGPNYGHRVIGAIPSGLPRLTVPHFAIGQITRIFVDAMILSVLGAIDSLLTAMISDSLTRTQHDSNRELIGQGIGNLTSGLCGGLPGAGATMGTVVNIQSGATTRRAGVIRSLTLMAMVILFRPLLQTIPSAVLAAIAVKVGVNILDWSFLGRAHRISTSATVVMYLVLLMTVFFDLIVAVGVGVFIANVRTIERLSNLPTTRVTAVDPAGEPRLFPKERLLLEHAAGKVLLFHLSGPMIFGVAQAIARESRAIGSTARVLVIDLADVSMLGTTVALALENVIRDAHVAGKPVIITGPTEETRTRLQRIGILQSGITVAASRLEGIEIACELAAACPDME